MTENQTPEPEQIDPELESPEDTEHEDAGAEENEETPGDDNESGQDDKSLLARVRRLNHENQNLRNQKKQAENFAKTARVKAASEKSERMQALEAVNARYEALAEHDLPLRLAKFITATEPEQILEQAEELLSLGSTAPKAPPQDQPKERLSQRRQAPPADELADIDKFAESIFRR